MRNIIKIGILIKEFEALSNWELRIVDRIINDQSLELSLLIKDGRSGSKDTKSLINKIRYLLKSRNIVGKLLLKVQILIEKKIFSGISTVNKDNVISKLKEINTIELRPKRKGFLDIFSDRDAEKIKNFNLDIILRHEFSIIRGAVLKSAKYGIWSFHHADNSINRGGPPGFWEIMFEQDSVGVTLQQLTTELDGGLVIDKAFLIIIGLLLKQID